MKELNELSVKYATEKTNEMISQVIAQAFADCYRVGYHDREEEIPIDLRNGKTDFVDLGLPSGTLWSTDYERDENEILLLPHTKASNLEIPSVEQWEELRNTCQWEFDIDRSYDLCKAQCVGPNGKILRFDRTGKKNIDTLSEIWEIFFWVKDEKEGNNRNAVHMFNGGKKGPGAFYKSAQTVIEDFFSGYKLPIRLVKK
jgi:hypothetical protein